MAVYVFCSVLLLRFNITDNSGLWVYFILLEILLFQDYIFSLLTGYWDAPEGVEVREGLAYNAYFPGGAIGMPPQLFNDGIEYEDGKLLTLLQCAKHYCAFEDFNICM